MPLRTHAGRIDATSKQASWRYLPAGSRLRTRPHSRQLHLRGAMPPPSRMAVRRAEHPDTVALPWRPDTRYGHPTLPPTWFVAVR
jgi:hypothetical protein